MGQRKLKMDVIGSLKQRIKLSRFHYLAEILLNFYWIMYKRPRWFSQTGEDRLIATYVPEKIGTYIDIGAGLPIRGSNTYFLYKRGWNGLAIDPISLNIKLSKIFRPRDHRLQICIGRDRREVDFYEFTPYGYSTMEDLVAQQLILSGTAKLRSRTRMRIVPAFEIAPAMNPSEPTLLSIDIEGADHEALSSIDWSKTRPRVICVEEWEGVRQSGAISELLNAQGYELRDHSGLSAIYVHKSWKPLS
jgi:hypothetical protein